MEFYVCSRKSNTIFRYGFCIFIYIFNCACNKLNYIRVNHIQRISSISGLISIIASEFCGNGIFRFYSGISHSTILCNIYALSFGSYFVCYFKTIGVYNFGSIESTLSNVCSIALLGKTDACILTIVNNIQCISSSSGLISIIASEFCGNGIFSFYTFCKCNNAIIVY